MNCLNIDWLKKNHTKIHYFGLGFIQIKISDNMRMHFYSDLLPPIVGSEDIHDHRYPFTSTILKGLLVQHLFAKIPGEKYILEWESCAENCEAEFIEKCDFKLLNSSNYREFSSYLLHQDTFHRVDAINAITLLRRPDKYAKPKARVARLIDQPKVCPFSKKVEEHKLWEIVENMIK